MSKEQQLMPKEQIIQKQNNEALSYLGYFKGDLTNFIRNASTIFYAGVKLDDPAFKDKVEGVKKGLSELNDDINQFKKFISEYDIIKESTDYEDIAQNVESFLNCKHFEIISQFFQGAADSIFAGGYDINNENKVIIQQMITVQITLKKLEEMLVVFSEFLSKYDNVN